MANSRALNELARLLQRADRGSQIAQELSGKMEPTFGKIVDVNDPERRGRVKVILDQTNPDFQTEDGYDQGESQPTQSDWIKPDIPFRGVQPDKLVGMRVPIKARSGDPNRLSFGAPIYDPEETEEQWSGGGGSSRSRSRSGDGGGEEGGIPENSDMVRMQVFPSGSLPDASSENHGCIVLEEGGPMDSDWLCVCAKRKGEFYWIRLVDLAHGHAGEDDGDQKPDSDGDGEDPVKENTVWDYVFPTTHEEYSKNSKHGTDPRDNPFGGEAKHHGGA
jgi:hypothetical protein